jgi:NitT/TauT family transport system ATP-binding protein
MKSGQPPGDTIVAQNASKLFLDGTVVAFRQLNLSVRNQEILCIVGPSGCGKTTFLRCIAGLTEISEGSLTVGGKPVKGPPQGVAMVFQHFGLLPWKTVYDNAAFGLAMAGSPAARCAIDATDAPAARRSADRRGPIPCRVAARTACRRSP